MKQNSFFRLLTLVTFFVTTVLYSWGQTMDYYYDPTFTPPNIIGGGNGGASVGSILVHEDGRFTISGGFQFNWPYQIKKFVRFHHDGTIDETFSSSTEPPLPGAMQFFQDGYLYSAGNNVIILNYDGSAPLINFLAIRYPPYYQAIPPPLPSPLAGLYHIMEDNKIMVVGRFYPDTTNFSLEGSRHLVRAMPDGSHDPTFEPLKCNEPHDANIIDFYPTDDGKWMVAGQFMDIEGFVSPGIARLKEDFSVDTTFQSPFPSHNWNVRIISGSNPYTLKGAIDEQNRVYITRIEPGHAYPLLGLKHLRLLEDGSIDTTFNVGEMTYYNHNDGEHYPGSIYSIAFEPDGSLLIGGRFRTIEGQPRGNIAKINQDGSLVENAFHRQGADTANWQNGSNPDINVPRVSKIVRLDNGGLMVGGLFSRYDGHDQWGLVRLLPSPVSVEENDTQQLQIYPNPASSLVIVEIPAEHQGKSGSIHIYNAAGKLMNQTEKFLHNRMQIPTNHLPNGMYFIHIRTDEMNGFSRFVKQ